MQYEIDFVGSGNEVLKDSDAICFRYYDEELKRFVVCVYDGGVSVHGELLKEHLNNYYFNGVQNKIIDYVICSHSDLDHASGLEVILNNFIVRCLVMNRPWLFSSELLDYKDDGRRTVDSIIRILRDKYKYIAKLEEVAKEKNIKIISAFQGDRIGNYITVLSPSEEFYKDLIRESDKTPFNSEEKGLFSTLFTKANEYIEESIGYETLREDVKTKPDNEMSLVLKLNFGDKLLLTGDAGIRALNAANVYAENILSDLLKNYTFYQIPHHGGRHNVSPSLLNNIIGSKGLFRSNKTAFVSSAKGSDHPKTMVVNAFIRRGVKVYKTNGVTLRHNNGMPNRAGWGSAQELEFEKNVEKWD